MGQTIAADILLLLAFVTALLAAWIASQPAGPEGPVGAWIVMLPPFGFAGLALLLMLLRQQLDWIPGGGLVRVAAALGVLAAFAMAMMASFAKGGPLVSLALKLAPAVIVLGCALALHARRFPSPRAAGMLFALAAVTGWTALGAGLVWKVRSGLRRANEAALAEAARAAEYEAQEVAEYRALAAGAGLSELLRYTWSRNTTVRDEARSRVSGWPALDEALSGLLDRDSEDAIAYVAHVMEKAPATLAPAWGRMMERQLKRWDVLRHDQYAGKWEPNLSGYFEGARKIQESCGDLTPQLTAWRDFLRKCQGLGNLATYAGILGSARATGRCASSK